MVKATVKVYLTGVGGGGWRWMLLVNVSQLVRHLLSDLCVQPKQHHHTSQCDQLKKTPTTVYRAKTWHITMTAHRAKRWHITITAHRAKKLHITMTAHRAKRCHIAITAHRAKR